MSWVMTAGYVAMSAIDSARTAEKLRNAQPGQAIALSTRAIFPTVLGGITNTVRWDPDIAPQGQEPKKLQYSCINCCAPLGPGMHACLYCKSPLW